MHNHSILHTENLSIGYKKGSKQTSLIQSQLNLGLYAGEMVCLLGANGCGKSTLIRTLAGVQPPILGAVYLQQKRLKNLNPRQIAQALSLVLTDHIPVTNLSVYDVVSLGRSPHTGWFGQLHEEDKETITWALEETEMIPFIERYFHQLSDGEKQKVMIARALAQNTSLIMLDEPTAHLDLPNRLMIFNLLRRLAKKTQKTILLSTHELDLALQVADKIWLMSPKQQTKPASFHLGTPEDLVLNGSFEIAFQREGFHFDKRTGMFKMNAAHPKKIKILGNGVQAFWTKRALERIGFSISQNQDAEFEIELTGNSKDNYRWIIKHTSQNQSYETVEDLLQALNQFEKQIFQSP